jgi:hypothetical protein
MRAARKPSGNRYDAHGLRTKEEPGDSSSGQANPVQPGSAPTRLAPAKTVSQQIYAKLTTITCKKTINFRIYNKYKDQPSVYLFIESVP